MYERFTDRARKVMVLANQEAQHFNHEYIGTEHILLGLVKEGSGVAANVLKNLGLDLKAVRYEVERLVQSGPDIVTMGALPQTSPAKKVIVYSMEEARRLNHNYVGTEHLLLGLLREENAVAANVLMNLGLRLTAVRDEVLSILGANTIDVEPPGGNRFTKFVSRIFEKPNVQAFALAPRISQQAGAAACLVAVDIGNSGIKFGQFMRDDKRANIDDERTQLAAELSLPEPNATFELPIAHDTGLFDLKPLAAWCEEHLSSDTHWSIATVHRGAGELLAATIAAWAKHLNVDWPIRRLTYQDVPLKIHVEEPARVGIDRLLAATAANRLRATDRAAIIVDLGTAITVDLLEADGGFAGGSILPGIAMAGRALAEQTDALPHVVLKHGENPPTPLGKSTVAAIEAGLYWGTVGAVGELVSRLAAELPATPEIFITGGASRAVAESLEPQLAVRYVPHLVLAGIALVDGQAPGGSRRLTD